jgi:hypothetical protein
MDRIGFLRTARAGLIPLATCIAVSVTAAAAQAQPKFWASAVLTDVELADFPTISVLLKSWRTKSTLVVDARVQPGPSFSGHLSAFVTVNGVELGPEPGIATTCEGQCFVSGRWVLDLDQANLNHPGVFTSNGSSGLPLTVELVGWKVSSFSNIGDLMLTAEIKKKK